jgi:hypothetical protein
MLREDDGIDFGRAVGAGRTRQAGCVRDSGRACVCLMVAPRPDRHEAHPFIAKKPLRLVRYMHHDGLISRQLPIEDVLVTRAASKKRRYVGDAAGVGGLGLGTGFAEGFGVGLGAGVAAGFGLSVGRGGGAALMVASGVGPEVRFHTGTPDNAGSSPVN